jgi:hypothetical protein
VTTAGLADGHVLGQGMTERAVEDRRAEAVPGIPQWNQNHGDLSNIRNNLSLGGIEQTTRIQSLMECLERNLKKKSYVRNFLQFFLKILCKKIS